MSINMSAGYLNSFIRVPAGWMMLVGGTDRGRNGRRHHCQWPGVLEQGAKLEVSAWES
ncbi:hypothetical protein ABIF38_004727 [Bradyrhizobium japonicum]|jgi:hypothetical protein|uniref:hypothetical protein n=1 Tax=Bradyrhizobium elkanii TaxID=29448 RepID=UPI0014439D64|nr:hypothetical protein [Bradyrhizobium elkanii]MCP1732962.1 hypothetical protein [Bradyrhizobium elkanii]MCS3568300.1 hypothetical protein [Bradyrhizobium elkanii]MCS3590216.1 hypothetical protein [Bradyrhizobium elkanii]MCS3619658.1 hypothetical protein [Bradyrhizobium elkanii]MCS3693525.1 hypothetical protein [Bradyrhizobium elkanii]